MNTKKYLCVVADDLGMHKAVNEGIIETFVDGILTDSNIMSVTPEIDEAIKLTKQHNIPVGLHATFTCDWDRYSWGPLTEAKSFTEQIGRLKPSVEDAWKNCDIQEAIIELNAQYDLIDSAGIKMNHIGVHMGFDRDMKFERILNDLIVEKQIPFRGAPKSQIDFDIKYDWQSTFCVSGPTEYDVAKKNLINTLENLGPGYHAWVTHPAIDDDSLDELCSRDFHAVNWARAYRAIDYKLLLDDDVANILEKLNITLKPLVECPVFKA